MDMVNIMVGDSAGRLLSKVPLSNNIISRRIQHTAKDLNDQLIEKAEGKEFRLQPREMTESNKDAHLICYTWFMDGDKILEDLSDAVRKLLRTMNRERLGYVAVW
ncbi:protein FAM200A-like [Tachypleus tridentatus]|uniref:protein FAM200A-like n=1 Tax=Tachypleus tridentatus TaxID=6853 RepID=UPI003FD295F1